MIEMILEELSPYQTLLFLKNPFSATRFIYTTFGTKSEFPFLTGQIGKVR